MSCFIELNEWLRTSITAPCPLTDLHHFSPQWPCPRVAMFGCACLSMVHWRLLCCLQDTVPHFPFNSPSSFCGSFPPLMKLSEHVRSSQQLKMVFVGPCRRNGRFGFPLIRGARSGVASREGSCRLIVTTTMGPFRLVEQRSGGVGLRKVGLGQAMKFWGLAQIPHGC